jgi:hypothetical protein
MLNIGVPLHTPNNVANNNEVELNIQMGRIFDDVWQTCDATIHESIQQIWDEHKQDFFNIVDDMELDTNIQRSYESW